MATAISEQIALKLKQRLQAIDEDSGYETTVAGNVVRPPKLWDGRPKDYQLIVVQGEHERNEALSYPGNPPAICWNVPFIITGEVRPSDESTVALDTFANEFASDVIKSICSPAHWYQWDGLAIDSAIQSVEVFNTDQMSGCKVNLMVMYRVSETNPYELRP